MKRIFLVIVARLARTALIIFFMYAQNICAQIEEQPIATQTIEGKSDPQQQTIRAPTAANRPAVLPKPQEPTTPASPSTVLLPETKASTQTPVEPAQSKAANILPQSLPSPVNAPVK